MRSSSASSQKTGVQVQLEIPIIFAEESRRGTISAIVTTDWSLSLSRHYQSIIKRLSPPFFWEGGLCPAMKPIHQYLPPELFYPCLQSILFPFIRMQNKSVALPINNNRHSTHTHTHTWEERSKTPSTATRWENRRVASAIYIVSYPSQHRCPASAESRKDTRGCFLLPFCLCAPVCMYTTRFRQLPGPVLYLAARLIQHRYIVVHFHPFHAGSSTWTRGDELNFRGHGERESRDGPAQQSSRGILYYTSLFYMSKVAYICNYSLFFYSFLKIKFFGFFLLCGDAHYFILLIIFRRNVYTARVCPPA